MNSANKHPTLHILFDSSIAYSTTGYHFLGWELSAFIKGYLADQALKIVWYLPSIVRDERRYQMMQQALELIPAFRKAEKLLGNKLKISEETLSTRINEIIEIAIKDHQLIEAGLDHKVVNWERLIDNSVSRKPPFGIKDEKGFRDAIVVEIFVQLAKTEVSRDGNCIVFLLTNDDLMNEAALEKTQSLHKVRVVKTVNTLQSAINAITAELTPSQIEEILRVASEMFYLQNDRSTLFYSENIQETIRTEYSVVITAPPAGARSTSIVRQKYIEVKPAIFLNRTGDHLSFLNRVTYGVELVDQLEGHRYTSSYPSSVVASHSANTVTFSSSPGGNTHTFSVTPAGANTVSNFSVTTGTTGSNTVSISTADISGSSHSFVFRPEIRRYGRHHFEVNWTCIRGVDGKLALPKLVNIKFQSTEWDLEDDLSGTMQ